jgi:hypothetical protein
VTLNASSSNWPNSVVNSVPTPTAGSASSAGPASALTGAFTLRVRVPARMRNLELGLLIIACAINASAMALVELGALGYVDSSVLNLGLGLTILVFAMHLVLRLFARDADPFILPIATVLNGLGIAMIYRRSHHHSQPPRSAALPVRSDVHGYCSAAVAVASRDRFDTIRGALVGRDRTTHLPAR